MRLRFVAALGARLAFSVHIGRWSRERGAPPEESSKRGFLPLVLDVAERTREEDEIDGPATDSLVGDVDFAASCV
jgi:hypothetical protein